MSWFDLNITITKVWVTMLLLLSKYKKMRCEDNALHPYQSQIKYLSVVVTFIVDFYQIGSLVSADYKHMLKPWNTFGSISFGGPTECLRFGLLSECHTLPNTLLICRLNKISTVTAHLLGHPLVKRSNEAQKIVFWQKCCQSHIFSLLISVETNKTWG